MFYPKQSLLRARIIAGISSKSEVLSQLRAKEDLYTVLKDPYKRLYFCDSVPENHINS